AGVVTLACTVEMKAATTAIGWNVILKRDKRHTLATMVGVEADNVEINCEIDCQSMSCQGVLLGTTAKACKNPNTDGLRVHDIAETVKPNQSPQYHAVYAGSCTSWTGTNMLCQRISGWGVQFNGNQQGNPNGSKIGQVTVDQAHGGVVFWNGAAVNEVDKALFTNFGSAGPVTTGGSHGTNPAVDYVTAPKPGYG